MTWISNHRHNKVCHRENSHDAGNGLKDPTAPISTLRRSGHPCPHNRIQLWEYNGLRGGNRGPFKGQQASASNPVMPVTQSTPQPTLLGWGPRMTTRTKKIPQLLATSQIQFYRTYQANETPLFWNLLMLLRCITNVKFAHYFIGYWKWF